MATSRSSPALIDSGLVRCWALRPFLPGDLARDSVLVADNYRSAIVAFRGTRIESFPDPILNLKLRLLNKLDLATDVDFRLAPGSRVTRFPPVPR